MEPLHALFPEIAERDRHTVTVKKRPGLPAGRYTFLEAHCTDPACDCRRVMVGVFSEKDEEHLATVEYRLAPLIQGKKKAATASLAEGAPQSPKAPALLALFQESLKTSDYGQTLETHYQLIRQSLKEPSHPIHAALRRLRQWVGARWSVPTYITGEGDTPYRPDIILWLDNRSGMILTQDLVKPDEPDAAMVDVLKKALRLAEEDDTPAILRVAKEGQAEALRAAFGEEFAVEVGPIPEIEPVRQSLEETLLSTQEETEESYLQEGRVEPESMARLFRASARLSQEAPWELMSDTDCLSLSAPALGLSDAVISVMGQAGQSFGFLLFLSAEEAMEFFAFASDNAEKETPPENAPEVNFFSLEFVPGSEMSAKVRREISQHRWEVASPKTYPQIRCIDSGFSLRPFGENEVAIFCAATEALCEFVSRHREALAKEETFSVEEEYKSRELPKKPSLKIVWPYPWPETFEEEEEELIPEEAAAIRDAFLSIQLAKEERSEAWLEIAGQIITALYYFKLYQQEEPLRSWKASSVKEFLLQYVPDQFDLQEEEKGWVPEILEIFFTWLPREKFLSAAASRTITQQITRGREEYLLAMNDPSRFGIAKRIIQLARAEGKDASPEALAQFVAQSTEKDALEFRELLESLFFEEEEEEAPAAKPASKKPKKAATKKKRKK